MTPFGTKCAYYAIHHVHKVSCRDLAKPLGIHSAIVQAWCNPFKVNNEVHMEVSKLGMIKMYEKYVEGGNQ
jgi:hypothetical protein